jgi:predicted nucleotidyltransferase component of viral defense system
MIWPILKDKALKQRLPLSTVVAEVFHLIVLDAVFAVPESQHICFRGGTSIHLLYGGYRFSEDLDFAGKNLDGKLAQKIITKSRSDIEKNIVQLLGNGKCEWRFPSVHTKAKMNPYWLSFQPEGKRMKYRIKMEFANFPVYHSKVIPAKSDFKVLHRHPLVSGLAPEELLAEKITATLGRIYFKGRDSFDLWYLSEVLGVSLDMPLVRKKFNDYHMTCSEPKIEKRLAELKSYDLHAEMNRFLPQRFRQQLQKDNYQVIRHSCVNVMEEVKKVFVSMGNER